MVEINGVYEELQYVKDTDAQGLFPLKKAGDGMKEGNFFSEYKHFNR